MKNVTAVAIGGSNTVMRPGYLTELPRCLKKYGINLKISSNLAVGNTTIFTGLINLKMNVESIKASDLLIIEYTLNDTSVFSSTIEGLSRWVRGMEGVIRYARQINPSIKIIPVIFATRTGMHRSTINPLHGGVHYLANYYGLTPVDVNASLVQRFGRDFFESPGAYGDYAHYQRPIFTTLAAEIIADRIKDYLISRLGPSELPAEIDPNNYANSKLIVADDIPDLPKERFKNYLYDETAFDLGAGFISIEVDGGNLLAAKFACTGDICRCFVKVNGSWFSANTMQPGMEEPKYKFLLSMISFESLPEPKPGSSIIISGKAPVDQDIKEMPQHGARRPTRAEVRLPVCGILYAGSIKNMRVELYDRTEAA
ncbi:MAG: hypothetical protein QM682_06355 [Paracoccus sp. (in: a-proteobacteria)]|uniref:SGNH/GDSL hydrolase family protein n=1 Tax=Paracoccus sp. TaxID=267 RepID=UPI0039E505F6